MNAYDDQVREYLAYCRRAAAELKLRGSALASGHHPTEAGAVKMIPHRGDPGEAQKIRKAFGRVTADGKTGSEGTAA